ncbi:hypothetical protein JCM8097_007930 [Rhodosporidiobolus ruineniae]
MAPPPEVAPGPPRKGFASLPVELKKRIVELVAQQDDVYKEWTTAVRPHLDGRLQGALDNQKKRYRSGIIVLSSVSTEFAELTAPHRFKVLKTSRADFMYQIYVAPRHARHIRRVEFDTANEPKLATTFSAIAQADNVDKVVIDGTAWRSQGAPDVVHRSWSPINISDFFSEALFSLSRRVPNVHLEHVPLDMAHILLVPWVGLRNLRLHILQTTPSESFVELAHCLASSTELEELEIAVTRDEGGALFYDFDPWTEAMQTLPPSSSIRRLSIKVFLPDRSALDFAAAFSPNLHFLGLASSCADNDVDPDLDDWIGPSFQDDHVFPLLDRLVYSGSEPFASETLNTIRQHHLPALRHLEVGITSADGDPVPLDTFLPHFPDLTTVRVHSDTRLRPRERDELVQRCGSTTVVFDHPDLPVYPSFPIFADTLRYSVMTGTRWGDPIIRSCRPFVKDLSAFLAAEVERAGRDDDDGAFVGLAAALRELELERVTKMG